MGLFIEGSSLRFFLVQLISILLLVLWIYVLIDLLRHKFKKPYGLMWCLIILFIPFFGPIAYLTFSKKHKL